MLILDHLLRFFLLCLLWLCELMGCKRAHTWVGKFVKEPDMSTEKNVV